LLLLLLLLMTLSLCRRQSCRFGTAAAFSCGARLPTAARTAGTGRAVPFLRSLFDAGQPRRVLQKQVDGVFAANHRRGVARSVVLLFWSATSPEKRVDKFHVGNRCWDLGSSHVATSAASIVDEAIAGKRPEIFFLCVKLTF
jgi:hypothetical protein